MIAHTGGEFLGVEFHAPRLHAGEHLHAEGIADLLEQLGFVDRFGFRSGGFGSGGGLGPGRCRFVLVQGVGPYDFIPGLVPGDG